jgi:hypothetical protein
MKLAEIIVNDFGGSPFCEHNYPCPVCRCCKAVLDMNAGRFGPCWQCQREGWRTLRLPKWLRRWFP